MAGQLQPYHRVYSEHSDQRIPYQRDRDRVLYSNAFRRLSGITQVARVGESYTYHDRLSHSLKVAQVATSLTDILVDRADDRGTDLSELDNRLQNNWDLKSSLRSITETAALAHDLGHPPFGHAIEKELDELVNKKDNSAKNDFGGFEGNAQSFRIVTKVAKQRGAYEGLNLSLASLNAMLKYPWGINDSRKAKKKKWGYYPTEQRTIDKLETTFENFGSTCLEAEIMDYADDVTYAVHDVDDFYRVGLVPLGQLIVSTDERRRFCDYICKKEDLNEDDVVDFFNRLKKAGAVADVLETPFKNTDEEIAAMNKFTSYLVKRYLTVEEPSELYIKDTSEGLSLEIDPSLQKEVSILKGLTYFYVIDNSSLRSQQYGERKIIRTLFTAFEEQAKGDADYHNIIPHPYRGRLGDINQKKERVRTVVDLICSMTEQQTVEVYERLTGSSPGSLREGILR